MRKSKIFFALALLLGALPFLFGGIQFIVKSFTAEELPAMAEAPTTTPPTNAVKVVETTPPDETVVMEDTADIEKAVAAQEALKKRLTAAERKARIEKQRWQQMLRERASEVRHVEVSPTVSAAAGDSVDPFNDEEPLVEEAVTTPPPEEVIVAAAPPPPPPPPDNTAEIAELRAQLAALSKQIAEANQRHEQPPPVVATPPPAPVAVQPPQPEKKEQSAVDIANGWIGVVGAINGMLLMWAGIWMKAREGSSKTEEKKPDAPQKEPELEDQTQTRKIAAIKIPT